MKGCVTNGNDDGCDRTMTIALRAIQRAPVESACTDSHMRIRRHRLAKYIQINKTASTFGNLGRIGVGASRAEQKVFVRLHLATSKEAGLRQALFSG